MQINMRMLCRTQHVPEAATKASVQLYHPCIQIHPVCQLPYEVHETNVAVRPWIQFLALSDNAPSPRTPLAHVMSVREQIREESKQVHD